MWDAAKEREEEWEVVLVRGDWEARRTMDAVDIRDCRAAARPSLLEPIEG